MFVNRSAMLVEAVFKSTFGFSYVLFVTVRDDSVKLMILFKIQGLYYTVFQIYISLLNFIITLFVCKQ